MSKLKKRSGSRRARLASGEWLMFDASELSWIALAIGGILLFAYMTGG
jgi:hypothetical protein